MSDTPRTDAAANESIVKVYETSKELERELAETTKDYHCLAELLDGHDAAECRANLIRMKQLLANNMRREQ